MIFKRKHSSKLQYRSRAGNYLIFIVLLVFGIYSLLPLVISVNQAFKPMSELYVFPPKIFVQNPTLANFKTLFSLLADSFVPFSRYLFNTLFESLVGTVGYILIAAMAAFPLAKYPDMPGGKLISDIIMYSLMISPAVADVANFQTVSSMGMTDTYWSILLPTFGKSFGFYLMRQFMVQLPDALIEAAKVDGASDFTVFRKVIMPLVKPAWLTLAIFTFQDLWNGTNSTYIFSEQMKNLPTALNQISSGGIARAGASACVVVIMMVIPIAFFLVSQNSIMETMATSGIKE
ncbi:MAG: carbohydrate ABC transporter permease [Tyzzerella sp.]|nr:carbohydrate ABC transporter permease [Tyzzerella sp.]